MTAPKRTHPRASDLLTIARECGAVIYTHRGEPPSSVGFTEAALTAFADRIRADERERGAQIAERNDAELVAYLIRGVPQRTVPRKVDGAWYWDERDERGEWQNYRSDECPQWASLGGTPDEVIR